MHGQAEDATGEGFADQQTAFAIAPGRVGRLQMHRARIVDGGWYACLAKRRSQRLPIIALDGVLRPGTVCAFDPDRRRQVLG